MLTFNSALVSASPGVTEYPLATGQAATAMVTAGGSTWYLSSRTTLSSMTTSGVTTDYNILPAGETGSNITIQHGALAADASGNVWFTGCDYNVLPAYMVMGYVNAYTGAHSTLKYSNYTCAYNPITMGVGRPTVDAAGNIWVDMYDSYDHMSTLAQFNSSGVQIGGWSLSGGTQQWKAITAGPNNSLWAVDINNNKIDQLTLSSTTDQVTSMIAHSPSGTLSNLASITVGPDGNLWFGENGAIGKMTPAGAAMDYSLPTGSSLDSITSGPDGALWFTDSGNNQIGRITTTGSVTEYSIPTSSASLVGITAGTDNALWFAESSVGKVGRISAAPFVTEYPLSSGHAGPTAIVNSGGSAWYINSRNSLSSVTPAGVTTDYNINPPGETGTNLTIKSNALAADASGNVWFTGCDYNVLPAYMVMGYVNSSTHAQSTLKYTNYTCAYNPITMSVGRPVVDAVGNIWVDLYSSYNHSSSLAQFNSSGVQIGGWSLSGGTQQWNSLAFGPNNSLWAVDVHNNAIDQLTISPTTDKVTSMTAYTPTGVPNNITVGSDGNLWFTESAGVIASMTPSGTFTYYTLPSGSGASGAIASGSDGKLWFVDSASNSIGSITTSGIVTKYSIPTASAAPVGVTVGPDNVPWFTESTASKIGRIGY